MKEIDHKEIERKKGIRMAMEAVPINEAIARGERIYFIRPGDTIDSCLEELKDVKEKIDSLIFRIRILSQDEKEKKECQG